MAGDYLSYFVFTIQSVICVNRKERVCVAGVLMLSKFVGPSLKGRVGD